MHSTGTAQPDQRSASITGPATASTPALDPSAPAPLTRRHRRGIQSALVALVVLGLAAILPPLVNVNRYQRRIAASISESLGRPVRMDSVTMNLLPVPGFTLTNFVVAEDPAFGSEPVIRSATVRANLRLRSLWHRRVEFSRIALTEPSVNLVHRADGRWNIESILLSASRIPVVPTDQAAAAPGGVQRFPYIEASGGRVNFKDGLEKQPISLTEADFALWLPKPELWRLRLSAHPTRTNAPAADTGTLRVGGTLGKATGLNQVPIDLQADWSGAPLGAASSLLLGRDIGVRGDLTLRLIAQGTLDQSSNSAHLEVRSLRRADFVPAQTIDLDINCAARAAALFHRLTAFQCASMSPDGGGAAVTGEVSDIRHWRSAVLDARLHAVPASLFLKALRVLSPRPAAIDVSGSSEGHASCCASIPASLAFSGLRVSLLTTPGAPPLLAQPAGPVADYTSGVLSLTPVPLDLGAPQPALLTIRADQSGLKLRLTGPALRSRLLALASALPLFGEGLDEALSPPSILPAPAAPSPPLTAERLVEAPIRLDLLATRPWGSPQTWTPAPASRPRPRRPPR